MSLVFSEFARMIDSLVHPSAAGDGILLARHRAFLAGHFGVSLVALAILPLGLAVAGPTSPTEAALLGWLMLPLGIALYLSRSGRLGTAHILSATVLTGLVVWLAAMTGGMASLILVWLVVVPFEAALSGLRGITAAGAGIALGGVLVLVTADQLGWTSELGPFWARPLSENVVVPAAILYAGGLALRLDRIARALVETARAGEERYRLLADHGTDMITRHSANGDVEFSSPAARGLTGLLPKEMNGSGLLNRIHIADRPIFLKALSDALNSGRPSTAEFRLRRANTEDPRADVFIDVEMDCRPASDQTGAKRAVVAVTRDISRQKTQEMELRQARDGAERANLARSSFLAHISHELRTALTAIIGLAEILKKDVNARPGAEEQRHYARLIHQSGEHLLEVVNGVLDASKKLGMTANINLPINGPSMAGDDKGRAQAGRPIELAEERKSA